MRLFRRVVGAVMAGLVLMAVAAPVLAAPNSTDGGVVRSYGTDGSVRQGMIVALSAGDATKVTALTSNNLTGMLGVAVSPTDAPIALSGDAPSQVYVATSGQYRVLVTTQNGTIHAGDYISISALNGVGMKAEDGQSTVLGRATADLTQTNIIQNNLTIKTSSGTEKVAIGAVLVEVTIGGNPSAGHGTGNLPGFLQVAGDGIANKPVAASRVYLALTVLLLAGIIAASVLYSGIRGGIVSIGRNPLAKQSILGAIIQAVLAGIVIFVLGLFAVYLLLRL